MMLSSNSKLQLQLPKTSSRSNSQENLPTNEKKIKFDDRNSWDCNEDNASTTKRTDSAFKIDYNDESNRVSSDEEAAPVSQLMGKLFPSLKKQKQQKLIQQQHEQQLKDKEAFDRIKQQQQQHTTISNNTGISVSNTNLSQSDNINANILKQKLAQLETEIERFQKKNIELAKLKEKCEAEIKSAEIQRKQFDRQKEEELARLKEIHDEEMKKLRLEKKIFEQYKQSLKETPDRKEREELERMKRQVNELADEIKLKESRWMANNSRLKERIETLEEEKLELKKELQFLEKQRIESLMSTNNNVPTSIINHQATKFTGHQTTNTSKQSPQSLGNNHNHNMIESNLFIDNSIKQQQSYEQITSKNSTATATNAQQVQPPNPNLMVMKRSISEKSLHSSSSSSSSTSSSSSCSSSSSASIGSTGSNSSQVRSHLNSDYYHQRQDSVSKNTLVNHQIPMQHLQPSQNFVNCNSTDAITLNYGPTPVTSSSNIAQSHQPINRNSYSPSSGRQATKSVKFKLDYPAQSNQAVPIPHSTPIPTNYEHDKNFIENNTSQNTSNTSNSSCSTSYSTGEEYVTTQSYGNQRKIRVKETRHFEDKHIEKYLEDGTTLTIFPNGTVKEVSADKRCTYVKFFNGDRKEMNHDSGTETYFYAETNITQIIYSNGMTILKFPSGQIEKHHTNKTREIIFPDKICKFIYPDGSEESRLPNGTCIKIDQQGGKVIEYPNKQREIHTKDYKRREYPDGSIKTVYTNGISETRYANGRTRIKDAQGNIISDKKA